MVIAPDYLILPMQPTPNGRLHIGHLAGPYLHGDILARNLRRSGRTAIMACGTDGWENWVLLAAREAGIAPASLARFYHDGISVDLDALRITPDIWIDPLSEQHRQPYFDVHERFVRELIDAGRCTAVSEWVAKSRSTGKFVIGTWIVGQCPECRNDVAGNSCTKCGAGFQPQEIINPRSRLDDSGIAWAQRDSLFVSGGDFDAMLIRLKDAGVPAEFVAISERQMRRGGTAVRVSQPGEWGVLSSLAGADGVLTNTFYEYCLYCAQVGGDLCRSSNNLLHRDSSTHVTALFGKDNAGVGLVAPLILSDASPSFRLFDSICVNHLLFFEGSKVSTSRHHGIWIHEIRSQTDVTSDELRFCLAHLDLSKAEYNVEINDVVNGVNWFRDWDVSILNPALDALTNKHRDVSGPIQQIIDQQSALLQPDDFRYLDALDLLKRWMTRSGDVGAYDVSQRQWATTLALLAEPFIPDTSSRIWAGLGDERRVGILAGGSRADRGTDTWRPPAGRLSKSLLLPACHVSHSVV